MPVLKINNTDPAFYPLLGPFLASRAVEKRIGYALYDDAAKDWFVATTETGAVQGFCYAWKKRAGVELGSFDCGSKETALSILSRVLCEHPQGSVTLATLQEPVLFAAITLGFECAPGSKRFTKLMLNRRG
jgi:hypothetical protein